MSKLKIALALAERGYAVFPLQANSRRPLKGSAGFKDATTEPWLIEAMWAEAGENANIGIYPWGSTPRQIVVDFEGPGKGFDLAEKMEEFERFTGQDMLAGNSVVSTPSGGAHVYLEVPEGCPDLKSTVRIIPGVDIRARGGYVVAPGSTVDGTEYRKSGEYWRPEPLTCADKLPKAGAKKADKKAATIEDSPSAIARAVAFLKETEPAIKGAGGDAWTLQTAYKVRDFGVSQETCLSLMEEHFYPRCVPNVDTKGFLARKVANAYEYAIREAGSEAGDPNEIFGDMLAGETAQSEKKPSRFFPHKVSSLIHRPSPKWLVDKTIPETGIGLLVGAWGSHKSFLAVDLAWSIVRGMPWGGQDVPVARPAVFLAGEGPTGIIRRFQAWAQRMNVAQWPDTLRMVENMPHLGEPDQVKELVGEIKGLAPGLTIVDTLSAAAAGADENSSQDMGRVLQSAKFLQSQIGGFILMIHHTGKDVGKGARGWSGLGGAADAILTVSKSGLRESEVNLPKVRDAEQWPEPRVFSALEVTLELEEPFSTLAFRHDPNAVSEQAAKAQKIDMRLQAMREILVPGLPPQRTKALASAIAMETAGGDLEPADFDRYQRTIEVWLRRFGQSPEGKAWLASDEGPAEWRCPTG